LVTFCDKINLSLTERIEMFDMGFSEIVFIVIVAVIFLGPDKLPETIRSVAKFFRKVKSITTKRKRHLKRRLTFRTER